MFSRINVKGIIILVVVLLIIQFTVGIFISPMVKKMAVEMLNSSGTVKMQLEDLKVWPVTLKVSIRGLKVFDPDGEDRIIGVKSAGCRLSFLGLLSKRIIFSKISLNGVDISIEGEPDGSFNIEKLAGASSKDKSGKGIFDRFKNEDWFSRIYRIIKEKHSEESIKKDKKEKKAAKKIKKEVVKLPKGRRVEFKTISDEYVLVVKKLVIKDGKLNIGDNNKSLIDINNVIIKISNLAIDPEQGMDLGSFILKGNLEKNNSSSGNISLEYKKAYKKDKVIADIDLSAKDIDLAAVSFIYDNSLPVGVEQGILDVSSKTEIINEDIVSNNNIVLRDHKFIPKSGGPTTVLGVIPIQTLCEALNQTTPLKLKFNAIGPVASPKITGFEKTLLDIVKPFMQNMIKDKGVNILNGFLKDKLGVKQEGAVEPASASTTDTDTEEQSADKAINTIKSLFNKD